MGGSDLDADADSSPNEGISKRKSKSKPGPPRKKTRKSKDSLDDAFYRLNYEDFKYAECTSASDWETPKTRAEETMQKLEIKQRKIDEEIFSPHGQGCCDLFDKYTLLY